MQDKISSRRREMDKDLNNGQAARNVVLVHGAFVDGSGWEGIYRELTGRGFHVTIVQNSTRRLDDDVALTQTAIDAQDGPVVLAGHSYGGVVITEAGNHPKVASLVYVAAFAPDRDESVATLIKDPPPGAPVPPILPPQNGLLLLDRAKFAASFAADLDLNVAAFMADSQVPWGVQALSGTVSEPAWKAKPSWYVIATEDRMIPVEAQRSMAKRAGSRVVEVNGSHAALISQPDAVAAVIERAGGATRKAGK
jgi:pimeloyl-ACP methyl ester carboxylesterase